MQSPIQNYIDQQPDEKNPICKDFIESFVRRFPQLKKRFSSQCPKKFYVGTHVQNKTFLN